MTFVKLCFHLCMMIFMPKLGFFVFFLNKRNSKENAFLGQNRLKHLSSIIFIL